MNTIRTLSDTELRRYIIRVGNVSTDSPRASGVRALWGWGTDLSGGDVVQRARQRTLDLAEFVAQLLAANQHPLYRIWYDDLTPTEDPQGGAHFLSEQVWRVGHRYAHDHVGEGLVLSQLGALKTYEGPDFVEPDGIAIVRNYQTLAPIEDAVTGLDQLRQDAVYQRCLARLAMRYI